MIDFQITPSIKFTDEYIQARNDLINAKLSFDKLSDEQKISLIKEFIGAEAACFLIQSEQKRNKD